MEELERLEGTISYVTFQSEDTGFTVLEMQTESESVTVVGNMVGVAPGQQISVTGKYSTHPSFGMQFKIETYEIALPVEVNAIKIYLSSGAVKGIGPQNAKKIVAAFGEDTLEVLQTDPKRLSDTITGISYKQACAIQDDFQRIYGIQDVIINVANYGLNARQAVRIYGVYGQSTIEVLHTDPFVLCNAPTFLPFDQVDNIANKMMFEYDNQQRIIGGIMYVMNHNIQNGHCCLPYDKLLITVSEFIGVEPEKVENVIDEECDMGKLFIENINNTNFIYTSQLYVAEMVSAQKLVSLIKNKPINNIDVDGTIEMVQSLLDIKYAENQKKSLKIIADNSVCIITGGPGTGKTTLVKGVITMFEMQAESVGLCAPTGRAAKRLSELSGKNAKTIHRLLEVVPGSKNETKFSRGPENPIPCDVLIIDEFSMVDIVLFSQLISAVKEGCRIVLVGDHNQLPAVGPGNILKDLIESKIIPCVELTDIYRQAKQSDIVINSHAINKGTFPQASGKTGDYFFIEAGDTIANLVAGLASTRLPKAYGFNTFDDIQVLCPSRKKEGGTANINAVLQSVINPPSPDKEEIVFNGITFREGDKVMQIKNNYDLEYAKTDGNVETGVFNGDIGQVIQINRRNKTMIIKIDDKKYQYSIENFPQLEHAWAVTVHKSQGSEFNAVILCINDLPKELMYRNLLYTAFTRAKKLLVVVGKKEILAEMIRNDKKQLRYSGIKHFLEEYNV